MKLGIIALAKAMSVKRAKLITEIIPRSTIPLNDGFTELSLADKSLRLFF